ncbi:MAG: alanine dehydrogenase [candidate division KSB1 bacterium]|nr:alanine dehydrogenase [candidate division KSB1 bacterium]MDZ7274288.1 alanine dehydrogenase [candidate division KSB1 bacterium]MDZ7287190.1 alanine dehydrogenase [candidate division KSB1 bacterium]MDZ7296885.1 alanine dehydrogenase [candidate division KSB1 bacterium]MDZ7306010.1 alanine dehydrogenase [candidate division KSB1 bacterium]
MVIGIPVETWRDEQRVALSPAGVYALVKAGHKVVVQSGAGAGCGFTDQIYDEAGAHLAFSAGEVLGRADMIVKVMPPSLEEVTAMAPGKTLLSFFNFSTMNPRLMALLSETRCTAIGYNLIEDRHGNLPVLTTMSEIAGMLLPQIAGQLLTTPAGGRGILLGGVAGIPAHQLNSAIATPYNIERNLGTVDVLVGAVMIHGQQSPHVVTEDMVRRMRPGSVIMDISIDQGGCVETSRPTTHSDPTFIRHGIIHYAVPNIPALVARSAAHALNNTILPLVLRLAEQGPAAMAESRLLQRGVYLFQGQCTQPGVAYMLGWPHVPITELLSHPAQA